MRIGNYEVNIFKTRHNLPSLEYEDVETLIALIDDYVSLKYNNSNSIGYDYRVIHNINITLNAARNKNCCSHNFSADVANVSVSYQYPSSVRLWLLTHELTHALYPITVKAYVNYSKRQHDDRPQEKLADDVATYIAGIDHNRVAELAYEYLCKQ